MSTEAITEVIESIASAVLSQGKHNTLEGRVRRVLAATIGNVPAAAPPAPSPFVRDMTRAVGLPEGTPFADVLARLREMKARTGGASTAEDEFVEDFSAALRIATGEKDLRVAMARYRSMAARLGKNADPKAVLDALFAARKSLGRWIEKANAKPAPGSIDDLKAKRDAARAALIARFGGRGEAD